MNTIELTGIDGQKITIDKRKIIVIEDNSNRKGYARCTSVYVVTTHIPMLVAEKYRYVVEKVFPDG